MAEREHRAPTPKICLGRYLPLLVILVVVLGYRLLSFWLPSLLGFVAATYLSRPQRGARAP